jgi:hypothetical protein
VADPVTHQKFHRIGLIMPLVGFQWSEAFLEDMLWMCVLDFKGSWIQYLPLAEFAYNNSFQETIGMTPYEALYGRKCRSLLYWDEVGER